MATVDGKKTGGRVAGTPNKVTRDLIDELNAKGYSPVAALIETAYKADKEFERIKAIERRVNRDLTEEEQTIMTGDTALNWLKLSASAAADILPYVYPKRKAVEHSGPNGTPLNPSQTIIYIPANGREKND
jgi:hypothetical protein